MKRLLTLVPAMSCGGVPAAGCARDASAQALPAPPARTAVVWPGAVGPVVPDPKIEARIHDLLRQLALEQKVAQMMQADIRYVTPEDERKYRLGSVFNGGGAFPGNDKHAAVSDWVALADRFYRSEEHTSELQSQSNLVCRLLLEKKKKYRDSTHNLTAHRINYRMPYHNRSAELHLAS